ncbi:MAG TPA: sulfotransferase [Gemmatimonadales bacterium]|nr:sulfotransferase [Gemmatimonadales bacterium]
MTLPDFLVIGAAKAGTTALYWYLAEHPAVFMSRIKETNFFAYGVDEAGRLLYGDPQMHHFPVTTRAAYEQLFASAAGASAVGEVSPIYLECPQAAERIRAGLADPRLIVSLRDPVDRAYSDYLMDLRHRGRRLDPGRDLSPDAPWVQPNSHWMRIGRYHEQLARYYERFDRSRIHVFLFDDLKQDATATVQAVYRFLGVADDFVPDFDAPHGVGGMPANMLLEGLVKRTAALRSAVEPYMPKRAANWARRVRTRNMRQSPPLPPELRQRLTDVFREDILKTSQLIGRSLDHWL